MRFALALAAAALIAAVVWLFASRTSGPPSGSIGGSVDGRSESSRRASVPGESLVTESSADERRVDPAAIPVQASTPSAPQKTGLTVRSSIGLELAFLEWETPERDWGRIDLEHGHCALGPLALPCRIRAPGHVAALARKDGDEIVLEPDALLVLEAHDLRTCTNSIRNWDPYQGPSDRPRLQMQRACSCGFLSSDAWALAVDHELIHEALPSPGAEPEAVILFRDHHRADVQFHPIEGARARWTVPCDDLVPGAPLQLHLERPAEERAGDVVLRMTRPHETDPDARRERFEWGSATIYPHESVCMDDQRLAAKLQDFTFDFVPTATRVSIAGRDEASSAYGRIVFVHDGSARKLVLRRAFALVGRVVSDVTSQPVPNASAAWGCYEGKEYVWGWQSGSGLTPIGADGVFELRGPGAPLTELQSPLDPPAHVTLTLHAPGFEPLEETFDTAGAQRFDCGELRLKPIGAQIVLAPGHELVPKSIEWMNLRLSSRPDTAWNIRNGALADDGSMNVYLVESDTSSKEVRLFDAWSVEKSLQLPWPVEPSRWMVIHVILGDRDEDWLFERQSDGRYVAVPRREHEIVLECAALPAPDKRWGIGWAWKDQWGSLGVEVPHHVGEIGHVRFTAPAEGASLWWSAGWAPPGVLGAPKDIGGSVPLDGLSGKIVLR